MVYFVIKEECMYHTERSNSIEPVDLEEKVLKSSVKSSGDKKTVQFDLWIQCTTVKNLHRYILKIKNLILKHMDKQKIWSR